ncbi:hypothetical protein BC835DRAFT_1420728 [Cytidiella melzeri]|nr:hypothetical protein BC835DRAFT_1420728 [Cytidiella melzeri]
MSSSQVLSPPPFPRRTSTRNTRLQLPSHQEEPPIPPRLIGSPLLDRLSSASNISSHPRPMWLDGNEFGTSSTPVASPVAKTKRSARQSPPPEPRYTSPPPPLPSFASTTPSRHATQGKMAHMADLLPSSQRYAFGNSDGFNVEFMICRAVPDK